MALAEAAATGENAPDPMAGFDPFAPGFIADPYPTYAHWRRTDPVHWGRAPDQTGPGSWYVFGHREARQVLGDDRFCVDPRTAVPPEYLPAPPAEHAPLADMLGGWFIFRDPPVHTRLRRAVAPAFAAAALERLRPEIDRIAAELVSAIAARPQADLIAELALPLPLRVIGRLLGLPDSAIPDLHRWSAAFLAGLDFTTAEAGFAARAAGAEAVAAFRDFMHDRLAEIEAEGGDGLVADLLTAARAGDLSRDEVVDTTALLVFAGHETTVNLIGNGMEALLRQPEETDRLRRDRRLLSTAVEEAARFNSPSQITFRFAIEDAEVGGRRIEAGSPIGVVIGSANRDEAVFRRPDRFDVGRTPNPHLSFGQGRHACLGGALARLEAKAAIGCLLAACPDLSAAPGGTAWAPAIGLRGLARFEVLTGASAAV